MLYCLSAFVFFKIDKIEVISASGTSQASSYYSSDDIIRTSGVNIGDSLVRVSKSNIADSIETLLPYIGEVTVKRSYPSTLKLIVTDTDAFFGIESDGTYTLLNRYFKVLGTQDYLPQGAAKLVGVDFVSLPVGEAAEFEDALSIDRINTLADGCAEAGVVNITKYDIENIANVKVVINSRITMILGTITDLPEKLSLGIKTMEKELENNENAHIIINVTDCDRSYVRDDTSPIEEDTVDYEEYSEEAENLTADGADDAAQNGETPDVNNEPVQAVG